MIVVLALVLSCVLHLSNCYTTFHRTGDPYAGVIEAWAAGSSWADIMKDSSLDDGDIARLLSRTVDVLRHAHFCDGLLINTRIAARKAMRAMNRNPIADLVQ